MTPDYIIDNWTGERLGLMVEKLVARKDRERETSRRGGSPNRVSMQALAAASGGLIKVEKNVN